MIRTGSDLIQRCNEWFEDGKFELPQIAWPVDNVVECRLIFCLPEEGPFSMIFELENEDEANQVVVRSKNIEGPLMHASGKPKDVENLMKCFKELLWVISIILFS